MAPPCQTGPTVWTIQRAGRSNLGVSFASLVASERDQSIDSLVRGDSAESLQLELRCHNGGLRWFEVRSTNMTGEPEVAGIVITASEISAQVEAELGLRRSEARFRSLVKHASDMVAILDSPELRSTLIEGGHRTVDQNFQLEKMVRSLEDLYLDRPPHESTRRPSP